MARGSLAFARTHAFGQQGGLCFYCDTPMWLTGPEDFAHAHGISLRQAKLFQVTGEHVIAHQDGGRGGANITAACLFCNKARHQFRAAAAPSAASYARHVRRRVAAGKWFPFPLTASMRAGHPCQLVFTPATATVSPETEATAKGLWGTMGTWAWRQWKRFHGFLTHFRPFVGEEKASPLC